MIQLTKNQHVFQNARDLTLPHDLFYRLLSSNTTATFLEPKLNEQLWLYLPFSMMATDLPVVFLNFLSQLEPSYVHTKTCT